jgi:hypothetical protein
VVPGCPTCKKKFGGGSVSDNATNQASEIESVNTSAFVGTDVSSGALELAAHRSSRLFHSQTTIKILPRGYSFEPSKL